MLVIGSAFRRENLPIENKRQHLLLEKLLKERGISFSTGLGYWEGEFALSFAISIDAYSPFNEEYLFLFKTFTNRFKQDTILVVLEKTRETFLATKEGVFVVIGKWNEISPEEVIEKNSFSLFDGQFYHASE